MTADEVRTIVWAMLFKWLVALFAVAVAGSFALGGWVWSIERRVTDLEEVAPLPSPAPNSPDLGSVFAEGTPTTAAANDLVQPENSKLRLTPGRWVVFGSVDFSYTVGTLESDSPKYDSVGASWRIEQRQAWVTLSKDPGIDSPIKLVAGKANQQAILPCGQFLWQVGQTLDPIIVDVTGEIHLHLHPHSRAMVPSKGKISTSLKAIRIGNPAGAP